MSENQFEPVGPLEEHPARIEIEKLLKVCSLQFGRASGPGGQHRNKVETAVRIKHKPTGIEAAATETRSQSRNRTAATFRLRVKLAVEIDWFPAGGPIPSELWSRRCAKRKIVCNPKHDDAPALLVEALLVCRLTGYDVKVAAETLECSSSQLIKFLGQFPEAREKIQREREQRGLHRLKF